MSKWLTTVLVLSACGGDYCADEVHLRADKMSACLVRAQYPDGQHTDFFGVEVRGDPGATDPWRDLYITLVDDNGRGTKTSRKWLKASHDGSFWPTRVKKLLWPKNETEATVVVFGLSRCNNEDGSHLYDMVEIKAIEACE